MDSTDSATSHMYGSKTPSEINLFNVESELLTPFGLVIICSHAFESNVIFMLVRVGIVYIEIHHRMYDRQKLVSEFGRQMLDECCHMMTSTHSFFVGILYSTK